MPEKRARKTNPHKPLLNHRGKNRIGCQGRSGSRAEQTPND